MQSILCLATKEEREREKEKGERRERKRKKEMGESDIGGLKTQKAEVHLLH